MKQKFLNLFGTGLLFISSQVFAQQCPHPLAQLDVQVISAPLKYEYQYTSRQLQNIKGNISPKLLGLFSGAMSINVLPVYTIAPLAPQKYCMAVTSAKVVVNINPIIYISRESQQFPCTKQTVEQHELLHYQFEMNTAAKAKPFIENMVRKHLTQQFYVSNQQETDQASTIFRGRTKQLMDEIGEHFEKINAPLHAKIDNPENYQNESSFCSVQENVMLNKLLNLKYFPH